MTRMQRAFKRLLTGIFIFSGSALQASETLNQQAIKTLETDRVRIQRHEFDQKRLKQNQQLKESFGDTFKTIPAPEERSEKSSDMPCFEVNQIEFIGLHHFPFLLQISFKLLERENIYQCFDMGKISQLVNQANLLLFKKGYVTSRAHLIEQDLSSGILKIHVTAGYIESYQLNHISTWQAFLLLPTGVLNYHYLNHGLDNLKHLKSNNPGLEIMPAEKIGYSTIKVDNPKTRAFYGNLSLRNDYDENKHHPSSLFNLSIDNLLQSNDLLNLSANNSLSNRAQERNQTVGANFSSGFQRNRINVSFSKSSFVNHVSGNNIIFKTTGETIKKGVELDYLLYRDSQQAINFLPSYHEREDSNFIEDASIDIQSGMTHKHSLVLKYRRSITDNLKLQFNSQIHHGNFEGFDAGIDEEEKSRFTRQLYSLTLNLQQARWEYTGEMYRQNSSDALLNDEQFSLYTSFIPGIRFIPANQGNLATLSVSRYFNFGSLFFVPEFQLAYSEIENATQQFNLAGIKTSHSLQWKNYSARLELGKPIKAPQSGKDIAGNLTLMTNL